MKGTIKDKREIERLFQTGRRSSSSLMTVIVSDAVPSQSGKCAFIAGKKLGVAPLRSRCKRVLRQLAYELHGPWKDYQVIFIAKKKLAWASHEKALKQIKSLLQELGVK